MKKIIFIFVFYSSQLLAALDPGVCTSRTKSHNFTLQEVSGGVQSTFEENDFQNWGPVGPAPRFQMSGKMKNTMILHDITLSTALKNRSLLTEMVVSILRSRHEFDGEEDISYSYADEYIKNLVCK